MTAEDLLPIIGLLNYQNIFYLLSSIFLFNIFVIELIRLLIVIRRSVKGRMDHVS